MSLTARPEAPVFLRDAWYVFGWASDLDEAGGIEGKVLLGQPVVVWRDDAGKVVAFEDRCPHRHAPLSTGRIEGDRLRCMYHGLTLDKVGACVGMPMLETPPEISVRTYPVHEGSSWIWVWMGDPARADPALIPDAFRLGDPEAPMRHNSIEYDAHYQLVHDNLCDLSHVDFVHETSLKVATGADWSASIPRVRSNDLGITIDRWFPGARMPGDTGMTVDLWSSYEFRVPGVFIMRGARYPAGTAQKCAGLEPVGHAPLMRNIEQQAVTPISETKTAYHYATGLIGNTPEITARLAERMDVIMATFEEDRAVIEAQQKIWNLTPLGTPKLFLPQDKAPHLMRQLMRRLIEQEQRRERSTDGSEP